jgi:alanine racemase
VGNREQYSNWVEVDLSAIENNILITHQRCSANVMAVVKANGYGHGAVAVAQAALHAGASWLGVARASEGIELRQAGLTCPVLQLGYTPPEKVEVVIRQKLSMTVWDAHQVEYVSYISQLCGMPARLHLKIDTGMNRIGVQPSQALDLANLISKTPGVVFEGVFTHFARADEADQTTTDEQENLFQSLLPDLRAVAPATLIVHVANSAASLYRPNQSYDLVRLGIAMYGLQPSSEMLLPQGFRPALSWKTILSHVKSLPPGRGVSYGHIYTTHAKEYIGTIPVGYADGFRRWSGNILLVRGKRVPVVGRVCMDQSMLQLDEVPDAQSGEEAIIIGSQGDERITAEEVAQAWGTINYEVVCGIGARVPRIYI